MNKASIAYNNVDSIDKLGYCQCWPTVCTVCKYKHCHATACACVSTMMHDAVFCMYYALQNRWDFSRYTAFQFLCMYCNHHCSSYKHYHWLRQDTSKFHFLTFILTNDYMYILSLISGFRKWTIERIWKTSWFTRGQDFLVSWDGGSYW